MSSNLIICQNCRFYFTTHRIRIHQKLCTILFKLTGNKNNNKLLSRLTPAQRNYITQYYNTNFNNHSPKQITYPQNSNQPKAGQQNSGVNKFSYKSPYQFRNKNPKTQATPNNTYQDAYSQRQIALYNQQITTNKSSNKSSNKKQIIYPGDGIGGGNNNTRIIVQKIKDNSFYKDGTVNTFLNWKNSAKSSYVNPYVNQYANPSKNSYVNSFVNSQKKMYQSDYQNRSGNSGYDGNGGNGGGYGGNGGGGNDVVSENKSLVPFRSTNKPITSMSLIPTSINFQRLIKGKNIALVGPSKSLLGRDLGAYIDKADLVVRLNKSLPIPEKRTHDIGSRTDILYNSLNTSDYPGENRIDPYFFLQNGVKYLCSPYPLIYPFKNDIMNFMLNNKGAIPFRYIDMGLYQKMENILKTRPYTGTCAILDLLKFDINKLFITGLDFYATSYYSEYRKMDKNEVRNKRKNNIHDAGPQIELLRNLVLNDTRIVPDSVLETILFSPYRNFIKNICKSFSPKNIFTGGGGGELNNWMTEMKNMEKAKIYFIGNNISIDKWERIQANKGVYDLIFCNINNDYLKNTGSVNAIIDNLKKENDDLQFQKGCSVMINIYNKNRKNMLQKWKDIGCDTIMFNTQYNNEMNKNLRKVKIGACSIDFYILLTLVLFMKHHLVYVDGLDLSQRRSENLFYKFLLREKMMFTF